MNGRTMNIYKSKPRTIHAVQWIGNKDEIVSFVGETNLEFSGHLKKGLKIKTLEGLMSVAIGDYIIRGVQNEFYPCKPDIFNKCYELE